MNMESVEPSSILPLRRYVQQGLEVWWQKQLRSTQDDHSQEDLDAMMPESPMARPQSTEISEPVNTREASIDPQHEPTSSPESCPKAYNAQAKAFYPAPQHPGLYSELIDAQLAAPRDPAKGNSKRYGAYIENLPPMCSVADLLGCVERAADVWFCELSPPNGNQLSCSAEIRFADKVALNDFLRSMKQGQMHIGSYVPVARRI